MYEYISAPIDLSNKNDLLERITCFNWRAKELGEFIQSKSWGGQLVSVDRSDENKPRISGSIPDELALEALYRRFRFFILKKDKSNYLKLLSLLKENTDSELLQLYCRIAREEFLNENILKFAFITAKEPFSPEDVINYWFNAHYFHSDMDKREKLIEFKSVVSENGARVALWHTVWQAARKIRNLAWLLRDTGASRREVYVPIVCILSSSKDINLESELKSSQSLKSDD